jgi:hypothetical protein
VVAAYDERIRGCHSLQRQSADMSQLQGGQGAALSVNAKSIGFLLLLTTALLPPFLDKPLHLDDPMYTYGQQSASSSIRGLLRHGRDLVLQK